MFMLNLIVAAGLVFTLVVFGWPWLKPFIRSLIVKGEVLLFSSNRPDGQAIILSLTGIEIGGRFFGTFTTQEGILASEAKADVSKIVMA